MKEWRYYTSDAGSIRIIHNSGAIINLSNFYGDGTFDYYIFNSYEELVECCRDKHYENLKELELWLNQPGWKVMDYDCSKAYDWDGVELKTYTRFYRIGTMFFIVTQD